MKKLSIVMGYYNRKPLLYNTLYSIGLSKVLEDVEIIIVDDGSSPDHTLDDIHKDFSSDIKVIRIEPEDKWYCNPCVPYNIGFKEAQGETILIQNPECYHVGDVCRTAIQHSSDKNYISFHCYSLDKSLTDRITEEKPKNLSDLSFNLNYKGASFDGEAAYYNHKILNPRALHFASAITSDNLKELGGFDERYANARGSDDNEFIYRVRKKGLLIDFVDDPMVFHQYHYSEEDTGRIPTNQLLFSTVTLKEKGWRANHGN